MKFEYEKFARVYIYNSRNLLMKFEGQASLTLGNIYNSRNLLMKFEDPSHLSDIASTTVEIY